MKAAAVIVAVASVASASAFVPQGNARVSTTLEAKKTFFQRVAEMDLFAPVADQNNYGARNKKNVKTGKIGEKSYVPAGLTAAEYQKIRDAEEAKKAANYQKNVAKAGKYIDFTEWYSKRGTDVSDGWVKSTTRGHSMAKTKFDWSGKQNASKKLDQSV